MSSDLTTVSLVRDLLGITTSTDDQLLSRLVWGASEWVRTFLSADPMLASYANEALDGYGMDRIMTQHRPIVAVTNVVLGQPGANLGPGNGQLTLLPTDYSFDARRIVLFNGILTPRAPLSVYVTYQAGSDTIPNDLFVATAKIVAYWYRQKSRIGEVSRIIAGETVNFSQVDVPSDVKTMLLQRQNRVPL